MGAADLLAGSRQAEIEAPEKGTQPHAVDCRGYHVVLHGQ